MSAARALTAAVARSTACTAQYLRSLNAACGAGNAAAGAAAAAWALPQLDLGGGGGGGLRALSYDINSRTKPHLNIGTIGHVDHGKVRAAVPAAIARTPGARARARARGAARRSGRLIAPHGCTHRPSARRTRRP